MANIVIDIQEVDSDDSDKFPGQRLREVREQRGLNLVEVATRLLLTEGQIKALEDNDFKHFPAPLFVSGYLRKYAGLLGIPAEPLVRAFENNGMAAPSLQAELTSSIRRPRQFNFELVAGIFVAIGVVTLLLVWLFSSETEPEQIALRSQESRTVSPDSTQAILRQATGLAPGSLSESTPIPENARVVRGSAAPVTQEQAPTPTPVPVSAPAPAPVLDRLLLRFIDDSWVEIADARGKHLYFNLGRAGQTRALEGQAPFEILLGNAPGVQIEYNGELYSHKRYNRKNVARFRLGNEGE